MHQSALLLGKRFFESTRQLHPAEFLDIGSRDINGTLRNCAPQGAEYVGVDLQMGNGVNIVLKDPYSYPFPDKSFDWVVSTSMMEHTGLFWLSFLECCRVPVGHWIPLYQCAVEWLCTTDIRTTIGVSTQTPLLLCKSGVKG